MTITHYDILEIEKTADLTSVKSAYRKKVKECHPDRNPGDKAAEVRFRLVQTAYEILSDENKRATYDWELKRGASQQQAQQSAAATPKSRPQPAPEPVELDMTGTKVVSELHLRKNIYALLKQRFSLAQRFRVAAYPKMHLLKDHKCGVTLRAAVLYGAANRELASINADRTPGLWSYQGHLLMSVETARAFNEFSAIHRLPKDLQAKYASIHEEALKACANYRGIVNGPKKR